MSDKLPVAFKAMETDLTVTMDDVVSAFVAKYENNLFDRKKELQRDIKAAEKGLREIDKAVNKAVKANKEWSGSIPVLDLIAKVDETSISWADLNDGEGKNQVRFSIEIRKKGSSEGSYYRNTLTTIKYKPIPARLVGQRKQVLKKLEPMRTELGEVLANIKTITRKERQVRGRIAMRKIEDSGYAPLMEDTELHQLVQL